MLYLKEAHLLVLQILGLYTFLHYGREGFAKHITNQHVVLPKP